MKLIETFVRRPGIAVTAGVLILGAGLAPAIVLPKWFQNRMSAGAPTAAPARLTNQPNLEISSVPSLASFENEITNLSENARQAVVNLSSGQGAQGSGFIYRADGWIVTNDHVVQGAKTVKVTLADGREFDGRVIAMSDSTLDLAMVKIDARDLPTLSLANSDEVKIGQFAIAIGSPFGLENTVTIGHVSGLGRSSIVGGGGAARSYSGMIQTDAAVNPGNSGGPLIDLRGNVIGVNSYIYSRTGASEGIGFAIPAKTVRVVAEEIIATGKLQRGFMGLIPTDLRPFEKRQRNLEGAKVQDVSADTPASRAGLKAGDILTEIGGRQIKSELDVRIAMIEANPGDSVPVTYYRNDQRMTTTMKVEGPPAEQNISQVVPDRMQRIPDELRELFPDIQERLQPDSREENEAPQAVPRRQLLGVTLGKIEASDREMYELPDNLNGFVIRDVQANSNASRLGLKAGDVITEVNGREIKELEDVAKALTSKTNEIAVKYQRYVNGNPIHGQAKITLN